ncbi:MAG: XcyI family restriction endonuclease [Candidatus Hydrogenedentota bacterium]
MSRNGIHIPIPELQIDFAKSLYDIRQEYLQEALRRAVDNISIRTLDQELSEYVREDDLRLLATRGLRGELLFATPCVLEVNPKLLGYYRLLLGFSQKIFYGKGLGISRFASMEKEGRLGVANRSRLSPLCQELAGSASALLAALDEENMNKGFLDNLALLTLGPQLRGGANVRKGTAGIVVTFELIRDIVQNAIVRHSSKSIDIRNASGRDVYIQFAPDPDIVIYEQLSANSVRNIIAIEVKSGTDYSNVHNRLGEAEKSHQKARKNGFTECWTIVNVEPLDLEVAQRESPSTDRFYSIREVQRQDGDEWEDFRNRLLALTGIPLG